CAFQGILSIRRHGVAAFERRNGLHDPSHPPSGNRTLRERIAAFDSVFWRGPASRQNLAGESTGNSPRYRNPHAEEPNAQPGGRTLHPMRPGRSEVDGCYQDEEALVTLDCLLWVQERRPRPGSRMPAISGDYLVRASAVHPINQAARHLEP